MVDRIMMRSAENHMDRHKVYKTVKDGPFRGPENIPEGVEKHFDSKKEEKLKDQSE